jgi:hypothetical protein
MINNLRNFTLILLIIFLLNPNISAQPLFSDISNEAGFNATGINRGIAIGDFDNDGDDDVYISRINESNMLYQNNGDGSYSDIAEFAGVDVAGNTHASVWGDFDNDGYLDLYVGNRESANNLYQNNGDGTFTDIAVSAGVDILGKPRSVLVADVDRDGWLDIYVANILGENALFRNNGDLTFTDITQSSGTSDPQLSMGAMFFDYDNDGDPDLYLTHDGNQAYKLLQNDGAGKFTDVSAASGTNYEGLGMGVDFGDINNDGWLDIYITNLSYNTLYLNNGDGTFSNISENAMITDPGMGWGTTFLDYNNDGLQDIYMVNDSYFSPLPNILYRNKGDLTFEIVSDNSSIANMYGSYGTACTDFNHDGRIDIFLTNSGSDGNQLFRNEMSDVGNWFKVKLVGTVSNRSAIGARVTLSTGDKIFVDEVCGGSGYASQNSLTLHFGLGDLELIEEMTIRWPNGLVETYPNLPVNQTMTATENESITVNVAEVSIPDFNVSLYPNPVGVNSPLQIVISAEQNQKIEIFATDLLGRKIDDIYRGMIMTGVQTVEWSDMNQRSGWYLITVQSTESNISKKVFIK